LYSDLVDNVFRVAPGKWTLWKCATCGSAYLDPRPTRETIHLAYANYHTHQEAAEKDDYASLSPFRKLRRRLANGYVNWRFSGHTEPSSTLGVLAACVMPGLRRVLDRQYRHLPRVSTEAGRLLDVGCGNGSFLSLARACGWEVVGLDPDREAVASGAKHRLPIFQGGIEQFEGEAELFDVITLDHVIEHVHDPVEVLKRCNILLKPGGQLWLETPNIESLGHSRFRENWRGLETPRHLVLFNRRSLSQAFFRAGFPSLHEHTCRSPCAAMFQASFAMEQGRCPCQALTTPAALKWHAAIAGLSQKLLPSRREFLTVAAPKSRT
jgi:2-polyprenyl-3-methyl-5-hydroxy-6-metoxy-1,4-benzoquinol methylase